jgi:hypothetical protein
MALRMWVAMPVSPEANVDWAKRTRTDGTESKSDKVAVLNPFLTLTRRSRCGSAQRKAEVQD